jgi:hypothetical protein
VQENLLFYFFLVYDTFALIRNNLEDDVHDAVAYDNKMAHPAIVPWSTTARAATTTRQSCVVNDGMHRTIINNYKQKSIG